MADFINNPDTFRLNILGVDSLISEEVVSTALNIIRHPKSLEGCEFIWVWNEDNVEVEYNYRVLKFRKSTKDYRALYWTAKETFADASDGSICLKLLITDLLLGDIWLL